jgi:hypothetical protein
MRAVAEKGKWEKKQRTEQEPSSRKKRRSHDKAIRWSYSAHLNNKRSLQMDELPNRDNCVFSFTRRGETRG